MQRTRHGRRRFGCSSASSQPYGSPKRSGLRERARASACPPAGEGPGAMYSSGYSLPQVALPARRELPRALVLRATLCLRQSDFAFSAAQPHQTLELRQRCRETGQDSAAASGKGIEKPHLDVGVGCRSSQQQLLPRKYWRSSVRSARRLSSRRVPRAKEPEGRSRNPLSSGA
jgi:hypothetical protein